MTTVSSRTQMTASPTPAQRFWQAAKSYSLAAVTPLCIAAISASAPASALEIRLKDAAPDRIERQRLAVAGQLPLPGTPNIGRLDQRLADKHLAIGSPLLVRIFKSEAELEIWIQKNGRFEHFATYPICHWSGTLGPKLAEGDKQSPEGFYNVTRRLLHRSGRWPQSLNLGFPNAYDKSLSRTGSYLLVHGGCSSVGCYAMTNPVMEEIYALTRAAIKAGQRNVPVHVFPFHMTDENLAKHKSSKWYGFWENLKGGYDAFNRTRHAPLISVCDGRYVFRDPQPDGEGTTGRPFPVCAQTAKVLRAFNLLDRIARRPSLWRGLKKAQRTSLIKLVGTTKVAAARRGIRSAWHNPHVKRGINRKTKKRVACDRRKASCKRFLAMKSRKANRQRARAARLAKRQNQR
ncbi:MAG: murein L,D-transpeptidase family protein [Pseudomonadota bacterium]